MRHPNQHSQPHPDRRRPKFPVGLQSLMKTRLPQKKSRLKWTILPAQRRKKPHGPILNADHSLFGHVNQALAKADMGARFTTMPHLEIFNVKENLIGLKLSITSKKMLAKVYSIPRYGRAGKEFCYGVRRALIDLQEKAREKIGEDVLKGVENHTYAKRRVLRLMAEFGEMPVVITTFEKVGSAKYVTVQSKLIKFKNMDVNKIGDLH